MLFKFSSPDMLNSKVLDASTGDCAYTIVTTVKPLSQSTPSFASGSSASNSQLAAASPVFRSTNVCDATGSILVSISWQGRRPIFYIGGEELGGFVHLFDTSHTTILPNALTITSRFDPHYIWTATPDMVTLVDNETNTTKGAYHQNAIRVPGSSSQSPAFIHTGLPGIGHSYLEFTPHPRAEPVELIVSFLMMEILRRGCFSLSPYMFERTKFWQIQEAKYMVLRKLRRNTL